MRITLDRRSSSASGFQDEQQVLLPEAVIKAALRDKPLLRGLLAVGAGYSPRAAGHLRRRSQGIGEALLVYCVKGGGWCELSGQLHTVRAGDLLVLPPGRAAYLRRPCLQPLDHPLGPGSRREPPRIPERIGRLRAKPRWCGWVTTCNWPGCSTRW